MNGILLSTKHQSIANIPSSFHTIRYGHPVYTVYGLANVLLWLEEGHYTHGLTVTAPIHMYTISMPNVKFLECANPISPCTLSDSYLPRYFNSTAHIFQLKHEQELIYHIECLLTCAIRKEKDETTCLYYNVFAENGLTVQSFGSSMPYRRYTVYTAVSFRPYFHRKAFENINKKPIQ